MEVRITPEQVIEFLRNGYIKNPRITRIDNQRIIGNDGQRIVPIDGQHRLSAVVKVKE